MDSERARILVQKYLDGTCTAEERAIIEGWYTRQAETRPDNPEQVDMSMLEEHLYSRLPRQTKQKNLYWNTGIAAAVAVLVLGAGLFYYNLNIDHKQSNQIALAHDVAPGTTGATLTLANGKKIRLSNAATGELAKEAGVTVTKSANGQLVYEIKPTAAGQAEQDLGAINTLSTAKGETYQVRLPDGSQVWLNAASSLTYSANLLTGGKRSVKLSGEGYFEISKDKAHPFIVQTDNQQVEVLGTHFNVNAYRDEPAIRTTLLEGSVRVALLSPSGSEVTSVTERVLKPSQQSVLEKNSIKIQEINAEDAVAWKNGLFVFEDESLEAIMRRVSRWYNVEVVFSDQIDKKELYGGSVSRYENVSSILRKLEVTGGIHFKIEGRRVFVKK